MMLNGASTSRLWALAPTLDLLSRNNTQIAVEIHANAAMGTPRQGVHLSPGQDHSGDWAARAG